MHKTNTHTPILPTCPCIAVNILPWRAHKRWRRRQIWMWVLRTSLGISCIIGCGINGVLAYQIHHAQQIASAIQRQCSRLDPPLKALHGAHHTACQYQAQITGFHHLQRIQNLPFHALERMHHTLPAPIRLIALHYQNHQFTCQGRAPSAAGIAELISTWERDPCFAAIQLQTIQRDATGFVFSLHAIPTPCSPRRSMPCDLDFCTDSVP